MSVRTLCFTCVGLALASSAAHSQAANLDDVRLAFAQAVHEAAPEYIHQRNPQPLLRAVVVLNLKLQDDDRWQPEVVRTNDQQPEMLQRAMDTASRVRLTEVPAELREHLQRNGIYETWLFDKDGSFQVKTLAKAQLMGR